MDGSGREIRSPMTGADMVPCLGRLAAEKGYRVFLLGARPEVAAEHQERDNRWTEFKQLAAS